MKIQVHDNYRLALNVRAHGNEEEYRAGLLRFVTSVAQTVPTANLAEAIDTGLNIYKLLSTHVEAYVTVEFSNMFGGDAFDAVNTALHEAWSQDLVSIG